MNWTYKKKIFLNIFFIVSKDLIQHVALSWIIVLWYNMWYWVELLCMHDHVAWYKPCHLINPPRLVFFYHLIINKVKSAQILSWIIVCMIMFDLNINAFTTYFHQTLIIKIYFEKKIQVEISSRISSLLFIMNILSITVSNVFDMSF